MTREENKALVESLAAKQGVRVVFSEDDTKIAAFIMSDAYGTYRVQIDANPAVIDDPYSCAALVCSIAREELRVAEALR